MVNVDNWYSKLMEMCVVASEPAGHSQTEGFTRTLPSLLHLCKCNFKSHSDSAEILGAVFMPSVSSDPMHNNHMYLWSKHNKISLPLNFQLTPKCHCHNMYYQWRSSSYHVALLIVINSSYVVSFSSLYFSWLLHT